MKDLISKYLYNNGQIFPNSPTRKSKADQDAYFQSLMPQMAMMTAPMPRGDIAFARQLAGKVDSAKYVNPEQFEILMRIAKQNLNIPKNIMSKMNLQQVLQELLGLAEKPR